MPSIEIVCIGQAHPIEVGSFSFAVISGSRLVSHRSPHPRFQSDFDQLKGFIYYRATSKTDPLTT